MTKPLSKEQQQQWKSRIENQQQSGRSITKWCEEHQISSHTFYYWKAKLFPKQLEKDSFTRLRWGDEPTILKMPGLSIKVESSCDPRLRKQIFACMGELTCSP